MEGFPGCSCSLQPVLQWCGAYCYRSCWAAPRQQASTGNNGARHMTAAKRPASPASLCTDNGSLLAFDSVRLTHDFVAIVTVSV
ncbi:hypothetical protein PVAP13_9NG080900 [Panicum virgatum]|uniref:Uncharacterized protein n=1 Tax=Panicum virgatum TaxID=38727 RepID=A0A8T0MDK4_PANVG|nr:hypothetical protein PVAP13_9NG080900 [Panicum virgatum]